MGWECVYSFGFARVIATLAFLLIPMTPAWSQLIISEFMAANRSVLADLHGEFPDWFEIYHDGDMPMDMDGWHASDDPADPTKWRFPSVVLQPGEYLVVFASAKNILDPSELHTNFEMLRDGEFLGLYTPDGTLVSSFRPRFPPQYVDFSFGRPMDLTTQELISAGAQASYFEPRDDLLGTSWTEVSFDDSSWESGPMGLGYDNTGLDIYTDSLQTQLSQVRNSLFVRIPFSLPGERLPVLELQLVYDAGFVAYLNGVEVASNNAPKAPSYRTRATQERLASEELKVDRFSLSEFGDLLVSGGMVPGDINLDGRVNIADPVSLLNFLFSGARLDPCLVDVDTMSGSVKPNDNLLAISDWQPDGSLNIADAISKLNFLFGSGVAHHMGPSCQSVGDGACAATCGDATNVVALHMLNRSAGDVDLFVAAELIATRVDSVQSGSAAYFETSTPGAPNAEALPMVAPEPTFSHESGTYSASFDLQLAGVDPSAEIRFSRDGTVPTRGSELYTGPVTMDNHTLIKARTYQDGHLPSPIASRDFLLLDPSHVDFSSDLPLVVLGTRGTIGENWGLVQVMTMEPGADGRSDLTGPPNFAGHGTIKKRGSSTLGRAKGSYTLEIQDELGEDRDVELLGFAADSDWVLYGAFNFDKTHMRNALMYELSRDLGRNGVRSQYCEVYLSQAGGPLLYRGIYTLMEKIKRGEARVPVERLGPEHINEPEISGGYMFKLDRADPGDSGLPGPFPIHDSLLWIYPKEAEMELRLEQTAWVIDHFNQVHAAMTGPNPGDPVLGYPRYIDVDSFVDEYLLRLFSRDPDAMGLSSYFFKPRNGRFEYGPLWDFDRALGGESRSLNPEGGIPLSFWWPTLVADPTFDARVKELYALYRQGILSLTHIHGIIDRMSGEIFEAVERDADQWGQVADRNGWQSEVDRLKTWIADRLAIMDADFIPSGP